MEEIKLVTRVLLWASQIAAFIAAIWMWQKYKNSTQRFFLYFLGFVLIIETLGYIILHIYKTNASFVYNIYIIIGGLFYLYWFKIINKNKILGLALISVFSIVMCYCFFRLDFLILWRPLIITLSILILINSFVFYSTLLNEDGVVKYQGNQKFWIVTGTLVFFINYIPLTLLQKPLEIPAIYYRISILVLNLIMYGFYTISFLCLKEK